MAGESHNTPPDVAGMRSAERTIRIAGLASLLVYVVVVVAVCLAWPRLFGFPVGLAERITFGLHAALLVLAWVVVAFLMVSTGRRFSPQDIGGSAAGPPSPALAIRVAFLQNTLEQAVIAAGAYLAVATLVTGAWLSLIPAAVLLFWIGRVLFLAGYRRGVRGRALGMCLTAMPTVLLYLAAIGVLLSRLS